MFNLNFNSLNRNEVIHLHALFLSLRKYGLVNDNIKICKDSDKWSIYANNIILIFHDIDELCNNVINVSTFNEEIINNAINYYNDVLKLNFSEESAREYFNFYYPVIKNKTR